MVCSDVSLRASMGAEALAHAASGTGLLLGLPDAGESAASGSSGVELAVTRVLSGPNRGKRLVLSRRDDTRAWLGRYEMRGQDSCLICAGRTQSRGTSEHASAYFTVMLAARCNRVVAVEPP